MINIRLTHLDGKMPNLALMKLSHWHKAQGHAVHFTKNVERDLFEPDYQTVYGSMIFKTSQPKAERLKANFPNAIIGGTGSNSLATVESIIGQRYEYYDYSIYPDFNNSIGFTQRGCRQKCPFCVVPSKEGRNESINSIFDIWRPGTPKKIILLDNDFFGQSKWRERCEEIVQGNFKICLMQGINARLITDEQAAWLFQMHYYDDNFKNRRLYIAWDNLNDEKRFFEGVDRLTKAGIKPGHLMVYFLIGYEPDETIESAFYRFNRIVGRGLLPFPMVYGDNKIFRKFKRWIIRRLWQFVEWQDYGKPSKAMGNILL